MSQHQAVTFLTSSGEEVSNDPIWLAQKTLGIDPKAARTPRGGSDDEDLDDDPYNDMNAKQLKALAAERGIDISGLKKVGEVREKFRQADAEEAAAQSTQGENPDDNDDDDQNDDDED